MVAEPWSAGQIRQLLVPSYSAEEVSGGLAPASVAIAHDPAQWAQEVLNQTNAQAAAATDTAAMVSVAQKKINKFSYVQISC